MATYWHLTDDVNIPGRWHVAKVLCGEERPRFIDCTPVRCDEGLVGVVSHSGVPLAVTMSSVGVVPLVTGDLAGAMASVSSQDVQLLPVGVLGERLVVVNALREVECLDESKSEFMKSTTDDLPGLAGQYRMVTKLRIRASAIPKGLHIFRVRGWRIALIVSDAVRRRMLEVGCHGARFVQVSGFEH